MDVPPLLRRQWRAAALVVLLMAATGVVASASDRGHEPLWSAHEAAVDAVLLSPDGATALALTRGGGDGGDGDASTLVAYGAGGGEAWRRSLDGEATDWAVTDAWVAVATPYPNATVRAFAMDDGTLLFDLMPGVSPRALAASGDRLAVALQTKENPVTVYRGWTAEVTHPFSDLVLDVDLQGEHLAVGTRGGELLVARGDEVLLDITVGMRVLDVALSGDGDGLLAGGATGNPGEAPTGLVQFYDLTDEVPQVPQWSRGGDCDAWGSTGSQHERALSCGALAPVGAVGLSADGARAVAMEEAPRRYRVHAFHAPTGDLAATSVAPGVVTRDPHARGVALSPHGAAVALASLDGDVTLLEAATLEPVWSYRAAGATSVAFARDAPGVLVANPRLAPGAPFDAVARFDAAAEPLSKDLSRLVPGLLLLEGVAGALVMVTLDRRPWR